MSEADLLAHKCLMCGKRFYCRVAANYCSRECEVNAAEIGDVLEVEEDGDE